MWKETRQNCYKRETKVQQYQTNFPTELNLCWPPKRPNFFKPISSYLFLNRSAFTCLLSFVFTPHHFRAKGKFPRGLFFKVFWVACGNVHFYAATQWVPMVITTVWHETHIWLAGSLTSLRFLDITNIIFSVFNPNFIFTHNTEKTLRSNPIKCVFFSHGNIAKILQIIKSQPECQDFEGLKMTSS